MRKQTFYLAAWVWGLGILAGLGLMAWIAAQMLATGALPF